jgi:hypothetical protein
MKNADDKGPSFHDGNTKSHQDCFSPSKVIRGNTHADTRRAS